MICIPNDSDFLGSDYKTYLLWGAWVAESVKHPTLDLSSGHNLMVCGFESRIGLCADSMKPTWDSLSPSLSLPLPRLLSFKNKHKRIMKPTFITIGFFFNVYLFWGHLGGSVGWVSDIGSGHDLTVGEFEPHIRLCADSSEPGFCFGFYVSLSLCPSPICGLILRVSQK